MFWEARCLNHKDNNKRFIWNVGKNYQMIKCQNSREYIFQEGHSKNFKRHTVMSEMLHSSEHCEY